MTSRLRRLLAVTVAAVACAGINGATASADSWVADGCPWATPHATLTVGQVRDSAAGYPADSIVCPRFIVDVIAPPMNGSEYLVFKASYAGPATAPKEWNAIPLSKADCEVYRQYVAVYSKPWISLGSTPQFTLVSSASFEGRWRMSPFGGPYACRPEQVAGPPLPMLHPGPAPLGYTYRIVASNRTTVTQPVSVGISTVTLP